MENDKEPEKDPNDVFQNSVDWATAIATQTSKPKDNFYPLYIVIGVIVAILAILLIIYFFSKSDDQTDQMDDHQDQTDRDDRLDYQDQNDQEDQADGIYPDETDLLQEDDGAISDLPIFTENSNSGTIAFSDPEAVVDSTN